jgi:hypothetical protein
MPTISGVAMRRRPAARGFHPPLNDVVVGNDVTGLIDDYAGAEAALDALAYGRQMLPQQWIAPEDVRRMRRRLAPYKC